MIFFNQKKNSRSNNSNFIKSKCTRDYIFDMWCKDDFIIDKPGNFSGKHEN